MHAHTHDRYSLTHTHIYASDMRALLRWLDQSVNQSGRLIWTRTNERIHRMRTGPHAIMWSAGVAVERFFHLCSHFCCFDYSVALGIL